MSKRIITIGRQFGSNGYFIAQELAERLNITCYDKRLIKLAAERTDIPYEQLKLVDEKKESPWRYFTEENDSFQKQYRYEHIDEVLFRLQSKIIKDLASKEDCIFVGRCADFVLADEPRQKSVFLYAPEAARIRTITERDNLDEKAALSLMKKMDKDRGYYYNFYTDRKWDDITHYDIAIDTNSFTFSEVVDILEGIFNKL